LTTSRRVGLRPIISFSRMRASRLIKGRLIGL
jgi:hypothetical protein